MLVETGRIVAVGDDSLWVETIRQSTCGSCAAQKGCGHGLLNRISEGRSVYIRVMRGALADTVCAVDDQVRIGIPEQVILRGSVVLYILPLFFMLAGAAIAAGFWPASPDGAAAAGAAAGLVLGFALVRWHAWLHRRDCKLQPILLEVLPASPIPLSVA